MRSSSSQSEVMSELERLWTITVDVWNTSFLGVSVGHGITAVVILFLGLSLRSAIASWIVASLRRLAEKSANKLDDAVVDALAGPLKLVPVIIALFFALSTLQAGSDDGSFFIGDGENLIRTLITIAIFWALHNAVDPVMHLFKGLQNTLTPLMLDWMNKALKVLFIIVGVAAILELWGISVGPIIAGLGLFGVAVGLGAQDLFKNLIAGLLILTEKRFLPGDWIKVDGVVEGTVEEVNFRSTLIRRFDKGPVYVPNAKLADNAVINFSRMTHRRTYWIIGVRYDASVEQLQQIRDQVLDYVLSHPEYAHPPEVSTFMRVDKFSDSSIDFMLYCFTKTTNWGEWLRLKEDLAFKIKEIVEGAGTDFAFPSTSVYLEQGAEVFNPPGSKSE